MNFLTKSLHNSTDKTPPSYAFTSELFIRLLGLIYLAAFVSFASQVLGLVGSQGILPVGDYLEIAKQRLGPQAYYFLPTVFWLNSSDFFLQLVSGLGILFSLLTVLGFVPALSLVFCWAIYLSLQIAGQSFMSFQWDILLLEVGFLAIFIAPWKKWMKWGEGEEPAQVVVWLFRWLLFRFMFSSGVIKLLSGDVTWSKLTALYFHYETQPLPTPLGWYAHQFPVWFQRFSCVIMFLIELVFPFMIFINRLTRQIAAGAFLFFMVLIAMTGNYCFFNLLTVALCLLLFDDKFFKRFTPRLNAKKISKKDPQEPKRKIDGLIFAGILVLISLIPFSRTLRLVSDLPEPVHLAYRWIEPFRLVNSYGLFAMMTTHRIEISVEGSEDGKTWKPYVFKHKPEALDQAPTWVAPHQPRLDWQMWFAALSSYQRQSWFVYFSARLLNGSKPVLKLLEENPFPGKPPKFIRALAYEYRFTNRKERKETGAYWKRELKGLYMPAVSLKS